VISPDGRYVAFDSIASNLVPNDTNGCRDIFVRDLVSKTTTLVSVRPSGEQGNLDSWYPVISAGGQYVAFTSRAEGLTPNDGNGRLPDVFVRDLVNQTTTLVSVTASGERAAGESWLPAISADGHKLAFQSYASLVGNDTNGRQDVYLASLA
jgi:Tol biopolymer transport system component